MVSLNFCQEYLNIATFKMQFLLWKRRWTRWYVGRLLIVIIYKLLQETHH